MSPSSGRDIWQRQASQWVPSDDKDPSSPSPPYPRPLAHHSRLGGRVGGGRVDGREGEGGREDGRGEGGREGCLSQANICMIVYKEL